VKARVPVGLYQHDVLGLREPGEENSRISANHCPYRFLQSAANSGGFAWQARKS
jgi:hypothetical protein